MNYLWLILIFGRANTAYSQFWRWELALFSGVITGPGPKPSSPRSADDRAPSERHTAGLPWTL